MAVLWPLGGEQDIVYKKTKRPWVKDNNNTRETWTSQKEKREPKEIRKRERIVTLAHFGGSCVTQVCVSGSFLFCFSHPFIIQAQAKNKSSIAPTFLFTPQQLQLIANVPTWIDTTPCWPSSSCWQVRSLNRKFLFFLLSLSLSLLT